MSLLSFIVYSRNSEIQLRISEELESTELAEVWAVLATASDLEAALRTQRIDGVYLDVAADPEPIFKLIESLPAPRPALVLGGPADRPEILIRGMRLGAHEFFVDHKIDGQLQPVLEGIRERGVSPLGRDERPHLIFAVIGAKGGVGTTMVASELATRLQALGERTAIVDLNFRMGDVAMHFDLTPDYSLADMARKGEALDVSSLRTIALRHASGVSVIAAPPNVEDASAISPSQVERCLELVRGEFDRVILDVSDPWEEVSLRALGMADRILIVTTIDVPSLSHTKRHVELLEQLGAGRDQIRLIVNRTSTGDYLDIREVESFLERAPDAVIPEDVATSTQSVNEGRLVRDVARNSKLDRAFTTLADQTYSWCDLEAPLTRPPKGLTDRLRELVLRR